MGDFTMDDFREEMRQRLAGKPPRRVLFRAERERRRIPTGEPRIADKPQRVSAYRLLAASVVRSAQVRLELYRYRSRAELVACPWSRLVACDAGCRCGGTGRVTVGLLVAHYTRMGEEYGK